MEVTRGTFPELLNSILVSIKDAEFVAIDCEYSEDRYLQTKEAAEQFTVVQLGICPVKWIDENNEFQCSPYNFNISPTLFERIKAPGLDRHYSNQADSIDFLLKHGFDFNKQLKEGVYYLNDREESLLLQYGTALKGELLDDLSTARGIRIVLEFISEAKKPVIGHNVFGDIARIYCNLMKGTMPDSLSDFCLAITNVFPTIIDTKYLARSELHLGISDDTSLARLVSWVAKQEASGPRIAMCANFLRYINQQKDHEAGYDAFCTAKVFVALASKIDRLRTKCPCYRTVGDSEDESKKPHGITCPCPLIPFEDSGWLTVANMLSINGTLGDGYLNLRSPHTVSKKPTLVVHHQPKQKADTLVTQSSDKNSPISPSWHTAPRAQDINREYFYDVIWRPSARFRSQRHYNHWRSHFRNYPNLLSALSKLDAHDNQLSKQLLHDHGLYATETTQNSITGENSAEENYSTSVWCRKDGLTGTKKVCLEGSYD